MKAIGQLPRLRRAVLQEKPREAIGAGSDWHARAGSKLARHHIIKHDQRHIVPPPGRRLHDDEAGALQLPPEALGNDLRHDPIAIVDALAALVSQRECYRSGEVVGRPAIDPELMIRMLIVGYCFGIRSERRCARRSTSTLPIAGSVNWAWTPTFPIIRVMSTPISSAARQTWPRRLRITL